MVALIAIAVVFGVVGARPGGRSARWLPPQVLVRPTEILADGYDTATLAFQPLPGQRPGGPPRISVAGSARGAAIEDVSAEGARIRAGVLPGRIVVRVEFPGTAPATVELNAVLDAGDRAGDGTPDFLRLDDEHDRQAFRRWFTYLAEAQYFQAPVGPARGNRRLRRADPLRLSRGPSRARPGLDGGRASARRPGLRFRGQVSIPVHAAGSRAVPRTFRTVSPIRRRRWNVRAVCRRANAVAPQHPPGGPRPGPRRSGRPAVLPPGGRARAVSQHDLPGREPVPTRRPPLRASTTPARGRPGEMRRPAVDELLRFPRAGMAPASAQPQFPGRVPLEHFAKGCMRIDAFRDETGSAVGRRRCRPRAGRKRAVLRAVSPRATFGSHGEADGRAQRLERGSLEFRVYRIERSR